MDPYLSEVGMPISRISITYDLLYKKAPSQPGSVVDKL